MAAYRISYYLYRSNPIIMREIKIPAECTAKDLMAAFCLAMGISVAAGKLYDAEEQLIPEKTELKMIFGTGNDLSEFSGRFVIYQDKKTQEITSLIFFYEVLEELEETISVPEVIDGTDYHLPQNVFRVGVINEIMNDLQKQESYTVSGIGSFYRGQQEFNRKKTRNLLYSWFLPEKVKLLKTEYAVPLPTVLENKTVYELRNLADRHRAYVYNTRKADFVAALNEKLCGIDPKQIFNEMKILEYLAFRELVLNGKSSCECSDDLYGFFPVLSHYGMISYSKKQGIFISSALMQEYEDWFDQEKEVQFRMGKRIASVMTGCRIYYGVFSKEVCRTILETLYPGEISEKILNQFWENPFPSAGLTDIGFTGKTEVMDRIAYDETLFNAKEEPLYLKVLSEKYTQRYIPDKITFECVSQNGIEPVLNAYGELFLFVRPYAYGDNERRELCMQAINCLRKGYPVSDTSKKLVEHFHYIWSGKEIVQKNLEDILDKIVSGVPNILYYGYSLQEAAARKIPPKAGIELNHLIRAAMEEEKRIKEEAAARKAAQKKKTTVKNSRTTGKRGSK